MRKFIDWLFLVKEIRSKEGELHFLRYRLFSCPLFSIYLHHIAKSDEDHPHSHPFSFFSLILSGGYREVLEKRGSLVGWIAPYYVWSTTSFTNKPGQIIYRDKKDYHKIELIKPTWTLVFTGRRSESWGYLVNNQHVEHEEYRKNKNDGMYI